jgi:hypothetical protein
MCLGLERAALVLLMRARPVQYLLEPLELLRLEPVARPPA